MVQKQFDSSQAIKCCLVGDGFVGKSYLASAFLRRTLPKCYKATLFEHLAGEVWLNEKQCTVCLYDTAGQQDYEAVRAFTYHQSDVIVMCFSKADRESLQNVQDVWVPEIRRYLGNKKQIILLGTQSDYAKEASPEQRIHTDELTRLADEIEAVLFLECSAYDYTSVTKVFECIVNVVFSQNKRKDSIIKKILKKLIYNDMSSRKEITSQTD